MKKYPDVTVKLIIKVGNEILMIREFSGAFGFPGGRVEWKESPFETLKRELKEEINYKLTKEPKLFDVWNYVWKNEKRHSVFITYFLKLNKKPLVYPNDCSEILWLTKKDILSRNIIKDKKFLDKIFYKDDSGY